MSWFNRSRGFAEVAIIVVGLLAFVLAGCAGPVQGESTPTPTQTSTFTPMLTPEQPTEQVEQVKVAHFEKSLPDPSPMVDGKLKDIVIDYNQPHMGSSMYTITLANGGSGSHVEITTVETGTWFPMSIFEKMPGVVQASEPITVTEYSDCRQRVQAPCQRKTEVTLRPNQRFQLVSKFQMGAGPLTIQVDVTCDQCSVQGKDIYIISQNDGDFLSPKRTLTHYDD